VVLVSLLSEKKTVILDKWARLILDTYPDTTSKFLQREKDRFVNPVGHTILTETGALYDELLGDMNPQKLTSSIDRIIRIRSVQDFRPSEAVGFVFLLKRAVREELKNDIGGKETLDELAEFESRVDRVALMAVDAYVECRNKINEIQLNEVKAKSEMLRKLLEKASPASGETGHDV
jgi:hypothetical protein